MNEGDTFQPLWIEWEILRKRVTISALAEKGSLNPGVSNISIVRTNEYQLEAHFEGIYVAAKTLDSTLRPGEFLEGCTISGTTSGGVHVALEDVYPEAPSIDGNNGLSGKANLKHLQVKFANSKPISWMSVWCLNGPSTFTFARWTNRTSEKKTTRHRDDRPGNLNGGKLEFSFPSSSGGADHCLFEMGGHSIRFCKVPKGLGPEWSTNVSLEFLASSAGEVPPDLAHGVVEALSFAIGKRLIPIGESAYDAEGNPIRETAQNPLSQNLLSECRQPEHPPTLIYKEPVRTLDESAISRICDLFLKARSEINLSESLSWYWMARTGYAEGSIIFLSAALEGLKNAWFKSKKSKSKGRYMDDAQYASLIEQPLKTVTDILGKRDYAERMLSRFKNANFIGANEQMEFFMAEIGLPLSEFEIDILGRVNRYRHGGDTKSCQLENLVLALNAYETIYHRALLKIIGYEGSYVDYSSFGFTVRPLLESIRGPEGDGKKLGK